MMLWPGVPEDMHPGLKPIQIVKSIVSDYNITNNAYLQPLLPTKGRGFLWKCIISFVFMNLLDFLRISRAAVHDCLCCTREEDFLNSFLQVGTQVYTCGIQIKVRRKIKKTGLSGWLGAVHSNLQRKVPKRSHDP